MFTKQEARVVVFGSGDWLRRLSPGLAKHGLTPDVVVGSDNPQRGQGRLDTMGLLSSRYISLAEFMDVPITGDAVGIVISRNIDHVHDSLSVLQRGIKQTLVEKPIALSVDGVQELRSLYAAQNGKLVASDHYLAKARPLEYLWGRQDVKKEDLETSDGRSLENIFGAIGEIGAITSVDARLVEGGQDSHGVITGRDWLGDSTQGGVFWDLAVHLFAIGARFDLFQNLEARDICAETYDEQTGAWRQISSFGADKQAELMATVRYTNGQGIPITIAVGKVGQRTDVPVGKHFSIQGEKGTAFLDLQKSRVDLELHGGARSGVILTTSPYELVVRDFKDALRGNRPDNVVEAVRAVALVQEAKQYYNNMHRELV